MRNAVWDARSDAHPPHREALGAVFRAGMHVSTGFERKTSYFTANGRPNGRYGLQVFLAEQRTQAQLV
jgi:hypothetical protein